MTMRSGWSHINSCTLQYVCPIFAAFCPVVFSVWVLMFTFTEQAAHFAHIFFIFFYTRSHLFPTKCELCSLKHSCTALVGTECLHRLAIDNLTATLLLSFKRAGGCPPRDTNTVVWCVCTETTNLRYPFQNMSETDCVVWVRFHSVWKAPHVHTEL